MAYSTIVNFNNYCIRHWLTTISFGSYCIRHWLTI